MGDAEVNRLQQPEGYGYMRRPGRVADVKLCG